MKHKTQQGETAFDIAFRMNNRSAIEQLLIKTHIEEYPLSEIMSAETEVKLDMWVNDEDNEQFMNDLNEGTDVALGILKKYGSVGRGLINTICRLDEGKANYWNPYWLNSGEKLQGIVDAVISYSREQNSADDLVAEIEDEHSALYKALNWQRLGQVTFLGRLGINHAKSLMLVEDEIEESQDFTY